MKKVTLITGVCLIGVIGILWAMKIRPSPEVLSKSTETPSALASSSSANVDQPASPPVADADDIPESARRKAKAVEDYKRQKPLREEIRLQEEKVNKSRKALMGVVRNEGIIYQKGDKSLADKTAHQPAPAEIHQRLREEQMQIQAQVESMLKYDNDQLIIYSAGLDIPENSVRTHYPKYRELQQDVLRLQQQGVSDSDPSLAAKLKELQSTRAALDEGVGNLRSILDSKKHLAEQRLAAMDAKTTESGDASGAHPYVEAKRRFEAELEKLNQLKLELQK
jgi:hypothetical protein